MRRQEPHSILQHLLRHDSSRREDRERARKRGMTAACKRRANLDQYGPLRTWLAKHHAEFPDLVALESIVEAVPPPLVEGFARGQVVLVVSHFLKSKGAVPLGKHRGIQGYHHGGAYLWALRNRDWLARMTPKARERWYATLDNVTVTRFRRPDHAEGDAAIEWLHDSISADALPTLVYAPDIADRIPADCFPLLTPGQRVRAAERFLNELGALHLGEHQCAEGRRKLWATRDLDRLERMKPRERVHRYLGRPPQYGRKVA